MTEGWFLFLWIFSISAIISKFLILVNLLPQYKLFKSNNAKNKLCSWGKKHSNLCKNVNVSFVYYRLQNLYASPRGLRLGPPFKSVLQSNGMKCRARVRWPLIRGTGFTAGTRVMPRRVRRSGAHPATCRAA